MYMVSLEGLRPPRQLKKNFAIKCTRNKLENTVHVGKCINMLIATNRKYLRTARKNLEYFFRKLYDVINWDKIK